MPRPKAWLTSKERWDAIPNALWRTVATATAKALYAFLVTKADETLQVFPSQETLMEALSVRSDNTVRAAIRNLENLGMIEVERGGAVAPRGQAAQFQPSQYTILPPRDWPGRAYGLPSLDDLPAAEEPPAESAEGGEEEESNGAEFEGTPAAQDAEGPAAKSAAIPTAESADDLETTREKQERAHARGQKKRLREPDRSLPTIERERADIAELADDLLARAGQNFGAMRVRYADGLVLDVFEHPARLILWRDGEAPVEGLASFMRAWIEEHDLFWQALSQRLHLKRRDWTEGPADSSYPARAVQYRFANPLSSQ